MTLKHIMYGVCLMTLVAACSAPDDQATEAPEQSTSRVPEDNVFSDQVRALEKAEDAKSLLDDAVSKQGDQINQSSQ